MFVPISCLKAYNTIFEDKRDTDVIMLDASTGIFQDCQFYSHTALFIASDVHGTAPEVRMANCFISRTDGTPTNFYWTLNTNLKNVLLRIWNITLRVNNKYYNSVDEDFDGIEILRGEIEFADSFSRQVQIRFLYTILHEIAFICIFGFLLQANLTEIKCSF